MRLQAKSHDQIPQIGVLRQEDAVFRKGQREYFDIVSGRFDIGRPDDIETYIA